MTGAAAVAVGAAAGAGIAAAATGSRMPLDAAGRMGDTASGFAPAEDSPGGERSVGAVESADLFDREALAADSSDGERRGRGRRRRGRRGGERDTSRGEPAAGADADDNTLTGRDEEGPDTVATGQIATAPFEPATAATSAGSLDAQPAPVSASLPGFENAVPESPAAAPVPTAAMPPPVMPQHAVAVAAAPAAQAAPMPDPVFTAPVAEAKPTPQPAASVPAVAAVPVVSEAELKQVIEKAGLQWVETVVRADASDEAPVLAAPRPARLRKPRTVVASEPLQQVETQRSQPEA